MLCVMLSNYEKKYIIGIARQKGWCFGAVLQTDDCFTERCYSWLAFGGARPIFQEIEDIQFYRSLELADVNCTFSCTVTYYFLDGINLASTWCRLHDKHFNVEYMLQIMKFLNIG